MSHSIRSVAGSKAKNDNTDFTHTIISSQGRSTCNDPTRYPPELSAGQGVSQGVQSFHSTAFSDGTKPVPRINVEQLILGVVVESRSHLNPNHQSTFAFLT